MAQYSPHCIRTPSFSPSSSRLFPLPLLLPLLLSLLLLPLPSPAAALPSPSHPHSPSRPATALSRKLLSPTNATVDARVTSAAGDSADVSNGDVCGGDAGATPGRRLQGGASVLGGQFTCNGPSNCYANSDGSVSISLTSDGGAGFTSTSTYTFGKFSFDIILPKGYSAGVCTSNFLINGEYNSRDEFDFEHLGSATDGEGMTCQTNWWESGTGGHEIRGSYGFDPTASYHTYTIEWTSSQTVWYVDGNAIRTVTKVDDGYPSSAMTVAVSIWDASQWATGPVDGRIPVNYAYAPFTATFNNFQYTSYS